MIWLVSGLLSIKLPGVRVRSRVRIIEVAPACDERGQPAMGE